MAKPIVAIVGRPNVGKSSLFNRLVGERVAIVEDTPGITRDRIHGETDWNGREFTVVDTGGLGMTSDDPFQKVIREQAEMAIEEADAILFVVDAIEGLSPIDMDLAEMLRRTPKPVLICANKADNARREQETPEFYQLGLGDVHAVAAHHGRGVADMLDALVALLPPETEEEEESDRIRVSIVGRPNVGKSSLLNAILGEHRVIVSEIPGTTRDPVDVPFDHGENQFLLVDTAGIRRPGKVQGSVEYYMVLRAKRAIERSQVAILVLDAAAGLLDGDKRVGGMTRDTGRGCVIFVNKWDLATSESMREFGAEIRRQMPFLGYSPIVFGSALEGKGLDTLLETVADVSNNHALRISTGELNRVLREATERRPYTRRGRELKVYYGTVVTVRPPTIVLFVNEPKLMHLGYRRYLENQLRAAFGFLGTPIRLIVRERGAEDEEYRPPARAAADDSDPRKRPIAGAP
jgi:GTP-binding protein